MIIIMKDLIFHVSLARCRLVLCLPFEYDDLGSSFDDPVSCPLSEAYYIYDPRPHYLIAVFPHCVVGIGFLPNLLLTRRTFRVPPTMRSFVDQRSSMMRRF
jgi:hypothetical protein